MQNKDVSNTTVGFLLYNTNHCLLSGNIINSSDYCGILLYGSSNYNTISNNTISHDYYGIGIRSSNGNTIISNKISRNIFRGITILYSNSNNVLSNFFFDNNLGVDVQGNSEFNNISGNTFLDDGVWVYNAWNNIFLDNYVNDKPLLYLEGKSDRVINESTGQIILVSCDRIEVKNQDISNTNTGILLMDTHHCVMHENTLRANKGYNIFLSHSNDNDIFANSITYSSFGITFDISDNNIIHHNIISTHGLDGIYLYGSNKNNISQNTIKDNRGHGIFLYDHSNNNSISSNTIESNGGKFWSANYGVFLSESSDNRIEYNNILKNARGARFAESYSNIWNGNYWNRPRILPKIILGETAKILFDLRINFDWHPALKPYDISQMS
jgi:parallel beta-helix repeat protein